MKTLEDQIDDLEKLDNLRRHARQLQKEAIEALTAKVYIPRPRKGEFIRLAEAKRPNWGDPHDDVEKALMLRALSVLEPGNEKNKQHLTDSRDALRADLNELRYEDFVDSDDAVMPIFRAALGLQALAETPGDALSDASFACQRQVVEELYLVAGPSWASGAARAGFQAAPTAFVTAECARALLALKRALEHTATAAELLAKEVVRESVGTSNDNYPAWQAKENDFRRKSFEITLDPLRPHLICKLPESGTAKLFLDRLAAHLRGLPKPALIMRSPAPLGTDRIQDLTARRMAVVAAEVAVDVINKLYDKVVAVPASASDEDVAKAIATNLGAAAQMIDQLLVPVEQYATSVIDRELAAGTQHLDSRVDAAELVFAANLLGTVSGWDKPKVRAAYETVCPLLSVNGRLLSIRPFDLKGGGYRLNVQTVEIVRRLADLAANVHVEPESEFFERLLRPFEDTRVRGETKSESGWTVDLAARESKSVWWVTALVVQALESINRMLDQNINRQVLRHFHFRRPESLKLGLDELFNPDFGLAAAEGGKESVALKLQQLRTHAGPGPAEKEPLFSMILYGPPGTGKTTLLEAVAKSANVMLVEITPSDIFIGGAEAVERRTRIVFQALSKLSHVVVLFDEFDSILLDRGKRDPLKIPTTVIEFLTPGMLPKLKALYDAAKERRISYALATNYLDLLDPAVTRRGRFDEKRGIYPPDPISRLGRLLDQLVKLKAADKRRGDYLDREIAKEEATGKDPARLAVLKKERDAINERKFTLPEVLQRVVTAVKCTRSAAMDKLGKPGWYTTPRDDKDFEKDLFGFIIKNAALSGLVKRSSPGGTPTEIFEPEAYYEEERTKYIDEWRLRTGKERELPPELEKPYWTDWKKVDDRDVAFAELPDTTTEWSEVFEFLDRKLLKGPI